MITIESLQILFDADHERDEVVFARLFAAYIERYNTNQHQRQVDAALAARDRSLEPGGSW